ncbi:hypothetical protein D9M72_530550 [compost metagenome]
MLPGAHAGIGRQAVFAEQQLAAGLEHPAHFPERGDGVRDAAQGEGADDAVEAGLRRLDLAQLQGDHLHWNVDTFRAPAAEALHLRRRIDADDCRHFLRVVEPQVKPGAHADLQHPPFRPRHQLRALLHHVAHAAGEVDQVRQYMPVIKAHSAESSSRGIAR